MRTWTRAGAMAITIVAACGGDPPDPAIDLDGALVAEGFTVQAGDAFAFGLADCADLPDCYASNASGSYVLFSVPPAPGAPLPPIGPGTVNPPRTPAGQSVSWQLAPAEAVVITGRTPPPARYFSVAPYLFERQVGADRKTVFASVADATNNANLAHVGPSPFDAQVALVIASDGAVEARARAALVASGWDAGAINTVVVAPGIVHLGVAPEADSVLALGRVALFDDPAAGAAYLADVPLEVRRVTADAAIATAPLPTPTRIAPVSATDETSLAAGVDALAAAIEAELGARPHTEIGVASAALVGTRIAPAACIARTTDCLGEVSDTVYGAGPLDVVIASGTLLLPDDPDDYFIVFGVNHEAAGLATYANVVVTYWAKRAGIAAFESPDMVGSADRYLPTHPDRDRLFAVTIKRHCAGEVHCLEIPTTFPGVPLDQTVAFLFRAYLAPGSTVAPDPNALITERVIHVTP
ncbi:MAG: hypothetical protein K8W52_26105 [Deltaproteobacteria bacterium]|nr:hypothetical protein [Deltaproteobacteria bacterium]